MTSFAGCHGIEVQPAPAGAAYGTTRATPVAAMRLAQAEIAPGTEVLWSIPVAAPDGSSQTHRMWRAADGGLSMTIAERPVLRVSEDRQAAVVGDVSEAIALQLVTTFALPLAAQHHGGFVVHASVAVNGGDADGRAIVVCADSGTGKSSVLVALSDAGWAPLTEDLVVIDLDAPGGPEAWPGPPWVRVAPGQPGPAGAGERFRTSDKIGWDLGAGRRDTCAPLAHLVFLDPPQDQPTEQRVMAPAEVIAALAHHTPWFEDPDDRAAALFAPSVRLARAVPASRIRLQRSAQWREEAVGRLGALAGEGRHRP